MDTIHELFSKDPAIKLGGHWAPSDCVPRWKVGVSQAQVWHCFRSPWDALAGTFCNLLPATQWKVSDGNTSEEWVSPKDSCVARNLRCSGDWAGLFCLLKGLWAEQRGGLVGLLGHSYRGHLHKFSASCPNRHCYCKFSGVKTGGSSPDTEQFEVLVLCQPWETAGCSSDPGGSGTEQCFQPVARM